MMVFEYLNVVDAINWKIIDPIESLWHTHKQVLILCFFFSPMGHPWNGWKHRQAITSVCKPYWLCFVSMNQRRVYSIYNIFEVFLLLLLLLPTLCQKWYKLWGIRNKCDSVISLQVPSIHLYRDKNEMFCQISTKNQTIKSQEILVEWYEA